MNRTNLIFTHAAVFAVGVAGALVANGLRDTSANPAEAEPGLSANSRQSASAFGDRSGTISGRTGREGGADGKNLSKRDSRPPAEQLSDIVRMTDSFDRERALMNLIDSLGPDQFAAFADQFRDSDHLGDARGEYNLLLQGWAKADPLGALKYADEHGSLRWSSGTILQTWAGADPAAAERWALDHYDGEGANPYMASIIRGVAGNDLATATRLALSMPRSNERGEAVDAITRALFQQGPEAAMAYASTITGDDALRGGFVSAIADRLVRKDPDQAAKWVASMGEGEIQNRAARRVSDALAREDVTKAAGWVKTLQPEAQAEAARGVIPVMSSNDIAGTANWVKGLAGTPGYDNVVEEFVWSCNSRAPEQSAAWIAGVSNPDQQRRLYHRMLGEWAQHDPAAVKNWVNSNAVPQDVLRRFNR